MLIAKGKKKGTKPVEPKKELILLDGKTSVKFGGSKK